MRRSGVWLHDFYAGFHRFGLPANPRVTKDQIDNLKFTPKSRDQWDYNGINERLTAVSEFGNMEKRPDFDGPREDNSTAHSGSTSSPGHHKRLYEYFDDYTQPGSNPKVEAAKAAREQWDASNFYYPGEAWQRNRPSFRSVPAEILNKQTWYHWRDYWFKWHEIQPTTRNRQYNPVWPPPGYKKPKFQTKREFVFGVEEPGLVSEIERWGWYRSWSENNNRYGPWELWCALFFATLGYNMMREIGSGMRWKTVHANQYYPGKQFVRAFGEPRDWDKEKWWWARPLDEFPNVGEVWYFNAIRYKYINHVKKMEEEERVAKELAAEGVLA